MIGGSMLGDLSGGFGGLELDHAEMDAVQPKQKTPAEQLDEQLGITAVNPFAVEQASRPSWGDRIRARRSTRGSDNPVNPVMDWLSGTDWSQARGEGKRPVLANLGPKALNAASFMFPQVRVARSIYDAATGFKNDPKAAGLNLLRGLVTQRGGRNMGDLFDFARSVGSKDKTFKQGLGNLFMSQLFGRMGKNRDVGQGIMSMIGGKDPRQALLNIALGRAGRKMDPTQRAIFGAGVQTMQGRPGREAFSGAFKNIATRQGMQKIFQRAFQRGGPDAVRKVQAAMQFMPSFTKPGPP